MSSWLETYGGSETGHHFDIRQHTKIYSYEYNWRIFGQANFQPGYPTYASDNKCVHATANYLIKLLSPISDCKCNW